MAHSIVLYTFEPRRPPPNVAKPGITYPHTWIYPWISTENLCIWIWIWTIISISISTDA